MFVMCGQEEAMSGKYIISHDVGTGGSKAVLVETTGRILGSAFEGYEVAYPRSDWAEQRPDDWWHAVTVSTRRLLAESAVRPEEILCMTFSTQMLGVVPVGADGQPLRPGIIWLDARAGKQARQIMRKILGPKVFAVIVGAEASGKDVLPKLLWLKENEAELFAKTAKFLDVNGYLICRSTGEMISDWSAASATGLFDLKSKEWSDFLIRFFGLPREKFPELKRSTDEAGRLASQPAEQFGLLEGTPVICGAGDAPAAAVGSGAVGEGEGHVYLGTSGWVGVVMEKAYTGKSGIASIQSADPGKCFLIAETETAGACLQWIADQFYRQEQQDPAVENVFRLMDDTVEQVEPGSNYLIFTPWMYGERAPVADIYVRSSFINLSADHQREHMLRAVYEGVAYNLRWMLELMSDKFGYSQETIRAIGGGARGDPWLQIIADVTGKRVERVANPQEAGAVGAALIAAIAQGIYDGFPTLKEVIHVDRAFEPDASNADVYDRLYAAYKEVYRSLKGVYRGINEERFRIVKE
jgi:xylulokinase